MHPLLDPPPWVGDPMHRFLSRAGAEPGLRWVRAAVSIVLVAGFLGFLVEGADRPADPYLTNHVLPGYRPPAVSPAPPTTGVSHP